jgi:hypothetical protein
MDYRRELDALLSRFEAERGYPLEATARDVVLGDLAVEFDRLLRRAPDATAPDRLLARYWAKVHPRLFELLADV